MPTIKILPHPEYCPQGATISAAPGTTICEAMLDHDINIEHACDMSCACTTCHVVVREGFRSLNEMEEAEEDLLDRAWGLEPNSRLSCQAILAQQDVYVRQGGRFIVPVPQPRILTPTASGSLAS